ncbi:IclR family transcriptional regulator [Nonomuraea sp. NPDC000554]|uniref:IclR family transcriptional regulator n=1 Tax=Nonomuraea sp. NPDC000554 TaxID=3154259 RepID=UPI0033272555
MAGGAREPGRTVVSRVLAILGAFDVGHQLLSLSDLAARTGMPLSTVHRLVGELVDQQALGRTPEGRLRVGPRLWELGRLAPSRLEDLARPWLHELFAVTGENVHLAVRDGTRVLYVDMLHGPKAVPLVSRVGSRLPMHPTGVGKALLAHEPAWFVRAYLGRELERPTPFTITQPGRLARELAAVRLQGYAVTVEEMSPGTCSIAAPILVDDRAVAAVGAVLSAHRSRELGRLAEPLLSVTGEIARACGRAGVCESPFTQRNSPAYAARATS